MERCRRPAGPKHRSWAVPALTAPPLPALQRRPSAAPCRSAAGTWLSMCPILCRSCFNSTSFPLCSTAPLQGRGCPHGQGRPGRGCRRLRHRRPGQRAGTSRPAPWPVCSRCRKWQGRRWRCAAGRGAHVSAANRPSLAPPRLPLSSFLLQTLAGIMMGQQRSTSHPILEPFYRLLAELKAKVGPPAPAPAPVSAPPPAPRPQPPAPALNAHVCQPLPGLPEPPSHALTPS